MGGYRKFSDLRLSIVFISWSSRHLSLWKRLKRQIIAAAELISGDLSMSTATLLKANPWVLPKWKQNFHGDVCCSRFAKFSPRHKFPSVKVASSWNSAPIPTSKNEPLVSFNFEARSATSYPKEANTDFGKNLLNFSILETLKWLKIPVLTMALLPALFFMKINGHYTALALTGGSMGGRSSSSSRRSSSSGSRRRSSRSSSRRSSLYRTHRLPRVSGGIW